MRNAEATEAIREVLDGLRPVRRSRRRALRRAYDAVAVLADRAGRGSGSRVDEVEERVTRISDRVPPEGW